MSDQERPEDGSSERPDPAATAEAPAGPDPSEAEPTRAYERSGWAPPSYVAPPQQPGPAAYQPGHGQLTAPYPHGPAAAPAARVPGWLIPVVAGLALVLGLVGGAVGGLLAQNSGGGDGSGGVLKVQRRTAAPLPADNTSVANVAAKVLPSTVQIVAEYNGDPHGATGSGFVFDSSGHIITNNHVVADAATAHGPIEVIDQAGRHFKAQLIGRSTVYDIAVLKAAGARSLKPAAIGSADQMRVGETVVAIGSPLGLSATVTSGIVSAVHRPVTTGSGGDSSFISAVQTDAAINPGNSGGPLVNLQGQVVGVNSAIASLGSSTGASDQSGNIGVGFAIPIEQVQVTTDEILKTGKAVYPVIGANIRGTSSLDGVRIESVSAGQPAAKAGLKAGDVIRKIDGQEISGSVDLVVAIRTHVPGDKVTLTIDRNGQTRTVQVRLQGKTG